MSKRVAAGVLWCFAGWYLGAAIALFLGLSDAFGPILGFALAVFFAGDPLGIIWAQGEETRVAESASWELPEDYPEAA